MINIYAIRFQNTILLSNQTRSVLNFGNNCKFLTSIVKVMNFYILQVEYEVVDCKKATLLFSTERLNM